MVAEPALLVNARNERASPAVDKCLCLCLRDRQEGESNECFRPRIVWYVIISDRIFLSRHRKSGHHLGSKMSKIIIVLSVSICKKSVFAMVFTVQTFLIPKKQILFFIKSTNFSTNQKNTRELSLPGRSRQYISPCRKS